MELPKVQRWSLTYFYCYPSLPRFRVLKMIKRWAGHSLSWKGYEEQVNLGRFRIYARLQNNP